MESEISWGAERGPREISPLVEGLKPIERGKRNFLGCSDAARASQDDQFHRNPAQLATGRGSYVILAPRQGSSGPNGRVFRIVTVVAPKIPARDLRAATPLGVARLRLGLTPQPLIALTRDARLVVTLKKVSDPAHTVLPVGSEVDLSSALLAHQGGVAVIDCAAVASPVGKLIDRVHEQFPELVLIVAGNAEQQAMLAAQITDGSVHRFLHRPVSEQRVRLFVEAAWRRHAQGGAVPAVAAAPRPPRRGRTALILIGLVTL